MASGCAGSPVAGPSARGARAPTGLEAKVSRQSTNPPVATSELQTWGRDDAPPGLGPSAVEAFVAPRTRELRRACWERRFERWTRGEAEYGLAVDPSGVVLPTQADSALSRPTAQLTRDGETTDSTELAECIERHVDAWTFPPAIMPTFVLLRFSFARADND